MKELNLIVLNGISDFLDSDSSFTKDTIFLKIKSKTNASEQDIKDTIDFYIDMLVRYKVIRYNLPNNIYNLPREE
jgi:hypothetical protein